MILIDILINEYLNSTKFKKYIKKRDLKNSVNFISYVNQVYEINVTNFAKIFNVSRQSIYKYLKLPTSELPKVLKDKIVYIYGFHSFDEVLKMEMVLSFKDEFQDEIESNIENGVDFKDINHPYKYLFKSNSQNSFDYIALKQEYQYDLNWKKAIAGIRKLEYQPIDVYNAYREFVSKHSAEYINQIFKKLNDIDKDDYEIIRLLNTYQTRIRRKNGLHR